MKGRISEAIARSIVEHAKAGRGPREIARLLTSEHQLSPPLSHVAIVRYLARTRDDGATQRLAEEFAKFRSALPLTLAAASVGVLNARAS